MYHTAISFIPIASYHVTSPLHHIITIHCPLPTCPSSPLPYSPSLLLFRGHSASRQVASCCVLYRIGSNSSAKLYRQPSPCICGVIPTSMQSSSRSNCGLKPGFSRIMRYREKQELVSFDFDSFACFYLACLREPFTSEASLHFSTVNVQYSVHLGKGQLG